MISRARLKFLRSLRRKKSRRTEGQLLLEGVHVIEEALRADHVRALYFDEAFARGPDADALTRSGAPVELLGPRDVAELAETETPSGAFALADDPCRDFDPGALPERALLLVAAGVADPGNLGTLVRTAAALGADGLVVTAGTVEPTNPKVVRATAGALFRLPVWYADVATVRAAGCFLMVADAAGEPLSRLDARPQRLALVVGNEPRGVDDSVAAVADATIAIPLTRGVESLNVAVAAGILLDRLRALPVAARA